jgi:hypothetical protein
MELQACRESGERSHGQFERAAAEEHEERSIAIAIAVGASRSEASKRLAKPEGN